MSVSFPSPSSPDSEPNGSYELPRVHPFYRGSWHGEFLAVDGVDTTPFDADLALLDVVLWSESDSSDKWDGSCAAVCRLKDGRYVAWETTWGPTGNGFSEDAYGGDANIFLALTLTNAVLLGLSENVRDRASKALGF